MSEYLKLSVKANCWIAVMQLKLLTVYVKAAKYLGYTFNFAANHNSSWLLKIHLSDAKELKLKADVKTFKPFWVRKRKDETNFWMYLKIRIWL